MLNFKIIILLYLEKLNAYKKNLTSDKNEKLKC
jgi:hypothetical protein